MTRVALSLYFFLAFVLLICLIPDLRFAFHLPCVCVSPAEVKKSTGGPEKDVSGFEKRSRVRYKMFWGQEKDCLKQCIEVEKKIVLFF